LALGADGGGISRGIGCGAGAAISCIGIGAGGGKLFGILSIAVTGGGNASGAGAIGAAEGLSIITFEDGVADPVVSTGEGAAREFCSAGGGIIKADGAEGVDGVSADDGEGDGDGAG
jgi:hypothetical protein